MSDLDFPYHIDRRGRTADHDRRGSRARSHRTGVVHLARRARDAPGFRQRPAGDGVRTQQHGARGHLADADPGRVAAAPGPPHRRAFRRSRSRRQHLPRRRALRRCWPTTPCTSTASRRRELAHDLQLLRTTPTRSAAPLGQQERHRVPRSAGPRGAAGRAAAAHAVRAPAAPGRRRSLPTTCASRAARAFRPSASSGWRRPMRCRRSPNRASPTVSTNCRARW